MRSSLVLEQQGRDLAELSFQVLGASESLRRAPMTGQRSFRRRLGRYDLVAVASSNARFVQSAFDSGSIIITAMITKRSKVHVPESSEKGIIPSKFKPLVLSATPHHAPPSCLQNLSVVSIQVCPST
mmetsp:Transcript_17137/g.69363  ORF Transcript_17137/g.69363 Transcript_17137/m.69363 type:complete len:127 (-) Transcript_17137:143-523(-)